MKPQGTAYVSSFELHQPIKSGAVARVVESKSSALKEGDYVVGVLPWQEELVIKPEFGEDVWDLKKLPEIPKGFPRSLALGVLGMPGLTAYFGLLEIGQPKQGETLFISGAAGAVGSFVGQIGKIKGLLVVGTAGDDAKVNWLQKDLGFDNAFNYKKVGDLKQAVARACPKGVDVYYDNVGGDISDAAHLNMNTRGRIPLCGQIASYNAAAPEKGPRMDPILLERQIKKEGFIVGRKEWVPRYSAAQKEISQWVAEGKIKARETVVEGFDNAPKAFIGLFEGANIGKMIVKVDPQAQ